MTFLLIGLVEGVFYLFTKNDHYKLKLKNTILYFNSGNNPLMSEETLPWPDRGLIVRIPDGPKALHDYTIGGTTLSGNYLKSKTALILPEDLNGDSTIFIVGGSAAFGYAYHYSETFASLLENSLQGKYRVINASQVGWSSGQLAGVVRRITDHYTTKAIILYSGNNEWVQWSHVEKPFYWKGLIQVYKFCAKSYGLSYIAYHQLMDSPAALMDKREQNKDQFVPHTELTGLEHTLTNPLRKHGEFNADKWHQTKRNFLKHYGTNLKHIHELSRDNKIPIIVLGVPFKLKLSPSWKHPQPTAHDPKNIEKIDSLINKALQGMVSERTFGATTSIDAALVLEPKSSVLHYIKAVILERQGNMLEAEDSYTKSREHMIGNLGSMVSINKQIQTVVEKIGMDYLDLHKLFREYEHSQNNYFNETLIQDDCHPNPEGHRIIADALFEHFK